MQEITGWPTGPVLAPQWRVTIAGVPRDPVSVDLGAGMDAGLPSQVVGGLGVTARTGTLTFGEASTVADRPASPWAVGWPPQKGDQVIIDAGYDGKFARVLTGLVQSTSGSTDGGLTVHVTDAIDRLDRRFTHPPVMSTGPRLDVNTASSNFISPGLTASYFAARAAAVCGLNAVPAMVPEAVAYTPLTGSAWVQRGILTKCERWAATRYDRWPLWSSAPWGQGPYDLRAHITPGLGGSTDGRITASTPLKLSFIRGRDGDYAASVGAWWGQTSVTLLARAGGGVTMTVRTPTASWTSPVVPAGEDTVVVGELRADGFARIRTSAGQDVTAGLSIGQVMKDSPMDRVEVLAPGRAVQVGAAQVWMSESWEPLTFTRTAFLQHTSVEGTLQGTKAIDTTVRGLLDELGAAELGAFWLDAHGRLHFRNRGGLVASTPVRTITTLDDIFGFEWERAPDSVKSSVAVRWTSVAQGRNVNPTITVWQGNGDRLEGDEPQEEIVAPPGDEEWVAVQTALWSPWDNFSGFPSGFTSGRYSWSFGSDGVDADEHYRPVESTMEQIGQRAWKLTCKVTTTAVMKAPATPNNLPGLPARLHGENLPIVRAKGRMRFHEEVTAGTNRGPTWAPAFEHDAGQWVQSEANAVRLAEALQDWMVTPMVTIRGVRIHPDPRLELGDVVFLRDTHAYNRLVRALIVGVSLSGEAGKMQMTLDVQVISTSQIGG